MLFYYNGETKFTPIHVTDLVEIIVAVIKDNNQDKVIECIGPEVLTFKQIISKLLISIKKRVVPIPYPIAKLSAKLLQLLPKPLLTEDQLKLLKYDNVKSGIYKTNYDIGLKSSRIFEAEINKYSYNWRSGGQFANQKIFEKEK